MNSTQIISAIERQGILPLFFHHDKETCINIVRALYNAGIRIVEFTNRGEEALENFIELAKIRDQEWKDLKIAAGTIKNTEQAKAFINAGADFLISPGLVTEVANYAKENNLLYVPGCMTPSEIMLAQSLGAKLIKLFPGNILGPAFMNAIRELFPDLQFMPTGGVEAERKNLESWFRSGVVAVGLGSKLITKERADSKDFDSINKLTAEALQLVRSIRQ